MREKSSGNAASSVLKNISYQGNFMHGKMEMLKEHKIHRKNE